MNGNDIDLRKTYGDFVTLSTDEDGKEGYECNICLSLADYLTPDLKQHQLLLKNYTSTRSNSKSGNFVSHLATAHPEVLVKMHKILPTYKEPALKKILKQADNDSKNVSGIGIDAFFKPSSGRIDKLDLTLWLLEDMRPFLTVEGTGFKKLINTINSNIKLPSSDTIAREAAIVDEALQKMLKKLIPRRVGYSNTEEIPTDAPFSLLSFTLDSWTSFVGKPYLGLTMHYITEDFEMKSHAMALRYFPPPHTASVFAEKFDQILDEYGIDSGIILSVTTDSASVMRRMMEDKGVPHTRCISHCINLAMQTDTFDKEDFKKFIEYPAKLAKFFPPIASSRNHIVNEKAIELNKEKDNVKAVQTVVTRWNSIYHMLEAHQRRFPIISSLSGKDLDIAPKKKARAFDDIVTKCWQQRDLHDEILKIMEPIAKWTTLLQSSTLPTISLVFEARTDILARLQPTFSDSKEVKVLRAHLKKVFEKRLNEEFVPVDYPEPGAKIHIAAHTERNRVLWKQINGAAMLDIRTAFPHI